jgi:hypothetical protein
MDGKRLFQQPAKKKNSFKKLWDRKSAEAYLFA